MLVNFLFFGRIGKEGERDMCVSISYCSGRKEVKV